jgi:hypothetical protein
MNPTKQIPATLVWMIAAFSLLACGSTNERGPARADPLVDAKPPVVQELEPATVESNALRLRVLNRETGEHLNGVEVLSAGKYVPWSSHSWQLRDPFGRHRNDHVLVHGASSPALLEPRPEDADSISIPYFIRSSGFGWKRIRVHVARGGSREVRLDPAGELSLQLTGPRLKAEASLRISSLDTREVVYFDGLWVGKTIHLSDLSAGHYRAAVESRDWGHPPLVFGESYFEILPKTVNSVLLKFEPPPARESTLVPLKGTLALPPAWREWSFRVSSEYTAYDSGERPWNDAHDSIQVSCVDSTMGIWSFDGGLKPSGVYELELTAGELWYVWTVVVGPDQDQQALRLPAYADVRVRLVDESGTVIPCFEDLKWTTSTDLKTWAAQAEPREGLSDFALRAPVGPVTLIAYAGEFLALEETIEVQPGSNEFTIVREPGSRIALRLYDGSTPVPLSSIAHYEHLATGTSGKLHAIENYGIPSEKTLEVPGRYSIEIEPIDGFLPIPTQYVDVIKGQRIEHAIQLTRAQ